MGSMQKEISLQEQKVSYTLRKYRRSRYMRLSVYPDGSVTVSVPWRTSQHGVEQFLRERTEWILGKIDFFRKHPQPASAKGSAEEYARYKETARKLAHERLEYWNRHYGFQWGRISIRNQKSRWGSCSRQGNLSFSYKIALLPPHLADYVIVHELCHLKEFNHSPKFWALVEKAIPDAKTLRKSLKLA